MPTWRGDQLLIVLRRDIKKAALHTTFVMKQQHRFSLDILLANLLSCLSCKECPFNHLQKLISFQIGEKVSCEQPYSCQVGIRAKRAFVPKDIFETISMCTHA